MPPGGDDRTDPPAEEATSSDLSRSVSGRLISGRIVPPEFIGPYRLLELLGEGGMGAVYKAEQVAPIQRTVAIKVIRGWRSDPEVPRRFAAERQALALMSHPNIAQVFDAGSTPDGLPYFVMEHVPGSTITQYCDEKRKDIPERITLFLSLCAAIQHAHQKGIVHRDLKPSNVLVGERDGQPVLKVIDFGIAKSLKHSLTEGALTVGHALVGTPAYMSPEQLRVAEGWDVDTRADVYALGVMLHELLAGELPFAGQGFVELAQHILHDDPRAPSALVSSHRLELTTTIAANRGLEPVALVRRLRGDLDSIVMKAIERDRERRYSSAAELQADLERYLRQEPVLATPPSRLYRARKFAARHRAGVAAALIATVALVAGSVAATVGLVRARQAQRRTAAAEQQSQAVSRFLEDMLASADPGRDGRDVKVVDVLGRASARVEQEFAADATLQARLLHTIGKTYLGLGQTREARALLESALARDQKLLGPSAPATLDVQADLVLLFMTEGMFTEAQQVNAQVLERRRAALGADDVGTLRAQSRAAQIAIRVGRLAEAEGIARATLEATRRVLGEEHPLAFEVRDALGWSLMRQGRLAEAEEVDQGTVELYRRYRGPRAPATLMAESSLAHTLLERGRFAEAEALLRPNIEASRAVLGPTHPDTFNAWYKLGMALAGQGRDPEAEAELRAVLDGQARIFRESHPEAVTTLSHLALAVVRQGRAAEARALVKRGLPHTSGPEVAGARLNFARVLLALGQPADAVALMEANTEPPPSPPDILSLRAQHVLGTALAAVGRTEDARDHLQRALEGQAQVLGANHPDTAASRRALDTLPAARPRTGPRGARSHLR
jgi:eukaryotic-like serine/threonine-protein kinase